MYEKYIIKMPLGVIFATSLKGIFALNQKLPWHCVPDMNFFKRITTGTNIVMGRKTMESIRSPLPNRINYVLTKSDKPLNEGFLPITFDECIQNRDLGTFWIIGGSEVLQQFMTKEYRHNIDIFIHNIIGESYCTPVSKTDNTHSFISELDEWMDVLKLSFNLDKDVDCKIYYWNNMCNNLDDKYLSIGAEILKKPSRMTRNGMVKSSFEPINLTASFEDGFPILKSKKVWWKGVVEEFDFFLSGNTDTNILSKNGVKIWEPNTSQEFLKSNYKTHLQPGDMGPMYGFQWRHFGEKYQGLDVKYQGLDQIEGVIQTIINDPMSRRILMTTYNPYQASEGVLYPCHGLITQFYVEDNKISLKTYQRSADWVLGVPFNISSYALLLDYIVKEVNARQDNVEYIPDKMTTIFGDAHIYESHMSAFLEQYVYYIMNLRKLDNSKVILKDKTLENYHPLRTISAKMVA